MHPSEASAFRRAITILITLLFTGGLLIFTGLANLSLLQALYPDPQFVIFGLLALEGGVIYWEGYYLLVLSGNHRAIAVVSLAFDAIISGTGFFYELQRVTNGGGTVDLPPVAYVIAGAVVFNVAMSLIAHLIPEHRRQPGYIAYTPAPAPAPKEPEHYYVPGSFEQTGETPAQAPGPRRPGLLQKVAANMIAGTADTLELAREMRANRRQAATAPAPEPPAPAPAPALAPQGTIVQEEKELEPELKKA